jgi:hypothetical protein
MPHNTQVVLTSQLSIRAITTLPRAFCASSRLSNSPTGLSILLSLSARMLSFYNHASLLEVPRGLSLSSSSSELLAVAAVLAQLTISATYEASNPCNPAIFLSTLLVN